MMQKVFLMQNMEKSLILYKNRLLLVNVLWFSCTASMFLVYNLSLACVQNLKLLCTKRFFAVQKIVFVNGINVSYVQFFFYFSVYKTHFTRTFYINQLYVGMMSCGSCVVCCCSHKTSVSSRVCGDVYHLQFIS